MSKPQQVIMVQIDASQHEEVMLRDIFGRVPVAELAEVLADAGTWQAPGDAPWQSVGPGRFRRAITAEVAMEIHIDGDQARVSRHSTAQVDQVEQAAVQARLAELLADPLVRDRYNFALNEVLGQTYSRAMRNQAAALGYTVVAKQITFDRTRLCFDVELRLRTPEYA